MSYNELDKWLGTSLVAPVVAARVTCPINETRLMEETSICACPRWVTE